MKVVIGKRKNEVDWSFSVDGNADERRFAKSSDALREAIRPRYELVKSESLWTLDGFVHQIQQMTMHMNDRSRFTTVESTRIAREERGKALAKLGITNLVGA